MRISYVRSLQDHDCAVHTISLNIHLPPLLAQYDICITAGAILVLNLSVPGASETLLAIRSRRYTTAGPVQSAVCNFGQVVGSPCLPVTACARGAAAVRFTLHAGTQTIAAVFALVNLVCTFARHSMGSRCKSASTAGFRFRTCLRLFGACYVSLILFTYIYTRIPV